MTDNWEDKAAFLDQKSGGNKKKKGEWKQRKGIIYGERPTGRAGIE